MEFKSVLKQNSHPSYSALSRAFHHALYGRWGSNPIPGGKHASVDHQFLTKKTQEMYPHSPVNMKMRRYVATKLAQLECDASLGKAFSKKLAGNFGGYENAEVRAEALAYALYERCVALGVDAFTGTYGPPVTSIEPVQVVTEGAIDSLKLLQKEQEEPTEFKRILSLKKLFKELETARVHGSPGKCELIADAVVKMLEENPWLAKAI